MSDSMIGVLLAHLFAAVSIYMAWGLLIMMLWFIGLIVASVYYSKSVQ